MRVLKSFLSDLYRDGLFHIFAWITMSVFIICLLGLLVASLIPKEICNEGVVYTPISGVLVATDKKCMVVPK